PVRMRPGPNGGLGDGSRPEDRGRPSSGWRPAPQARAETTAGLRPGAGGRCPAPPNECHRECPDGEPPKVGRGFARAEASNVRPRSRRIMSEPEEGVAAPQRRESGGERTGGPPPPRGPDTPGAALPSPPQTTGREARPDRGRSCTAGARGVAS